MIELRVLFHEPLVLLDRHLLGGDGETAGDRSAVRRLVPSIRSGSVGGEPMRNSTGPSITAKVWPWLFTYQRRLPRSLSFFNSASIFLSFSSCFHCRSVHSAAP